MTSNIAVKMSESPEDSWRRKCSALQTKVDKATENAAYWDQQPKTEESKHKKRKADKEQEQVEDEHEQAKAELQMIIDGALLPKQ